LTTKSQPRVKGPRVFFFFFCALPRGISSLYFPSFEDHSRAAVICPAVLLILPFHDPLLSFLSRMSENTSSIATSRPSRSTRGAAVAASSKTTATANTKPREGAATKKNGAGAAKKKGNGKSKGEVYCVCRGRDYGTPMIFCGACREWYHFSCLGVEEEDAEDIEVYICGPCSLDTGLRTASESPPFSICTCVVVSPLSSLEHERRKCHVLCPVSLCPLCAYKSRVNLCPSCALCDRPFVHSTFAPSRLLFMIPSLRVLGRSFLVVLGERRESRDRWSKCQRGQRQQRFDFLTS